MPLLYQKNGKICTHGFVIKKGQGPMFFSCGALKGVWVLEFVVFAIQKDPNFQKRDFMGVGFVFN